MVNQIDEIAYAEFLEEIADAKACVIVSSINFEECSIALTKDLLEFVGRHALKTFHFRPFRLVSKRASPWSALELVKKQLQNDLIQVADGHGIPLDVSEIEYPAEQSKAFDLIAAASEIDEDDLLLILDISALPRMLSVFFCDILCGISNTSLQERFKRIFVVDTPPQRVTGRRGLGPFSVGGPHIVYRKELIRDLPRNLKASLLVFPGYEGFEARAALDGISGHNALSLVAINCYEGSFSHAMKIAIANQSVFKEDEYTNSNIRYYFSPVDGLRLALEFVEQVVKISEEFPRHQHAFFVAPYGPKWSVLVGTVARAVFLRRIKQKISGVIANTDVLVLKESQYVSLHSRGALQPQVFVLVNE